jgi:hypothetical protein
MGDTVPSCILYPASCIPDVRVFRWPGSVLGARCSVLGVNPVPGIRYQVPGSWCPTPGTRDLAPDIWRNAWLMLQKPAHGVRILHPVSCILHPASCILHPRHFVNDPRSCGRGLDKWGPG